MPFSYDIDPDDSSRSRRRSQHIEKQNSERIEYKALGQNIGQLARGAVAFDPNAEDGDGDGLVQDNTPYERPSVLSNIANTVRQGLASATGSQTYFTNGMSPTVGMTNREVAEHAVPDNPARFLEMRLQQQAILGLTNSNPNIQEDLEKISFDPKGIEQLRNLVERTLDERPALRVAWDRFGVPPIGISEGKNGYAGVFLSDSILMDDDSLKAKPITSAFSNARMISAISSTGLGAPKIKGIKRAFVSTDPRDTITHEWGHYLQQLTSRLHPDRNIREAATLLDARWWDNGSYYKEQLSRHPQLGRLFDYFAEVSKNFSDKQELPDDSVPFVSSAYGTTQPSEFVAEAISAYFSPDKKTRELLNEAGVDLVEKTFLGIRGGLASTSSGRRTTTGSSMRGLTPEQMAERIVPSTLEEAILSMEDHQKMMAINGEGVNTEALKLVVPKGVDDLDFSPEAVKEMREVITKALAENRMFRDVVERHGFPPVLATKRGAKWVDGDGTYAVSMIEGFPSIIVNRDSRNQILLAGGAPNGIFPEEGKLEGTNSFLVGENENSLMAHEWGHYINRLAASIHPDPEIRALATFWFSDTWDHDAGLTGPWKALDKLGINVGDDKASQRIIGARRFSEKVKKSKSEKWTGYPHVLSQYGQTMPAEAFAEGVSAILVGDESARGLVSPALKDDIFDIIGKPESYQRDIAGGISERRAGLASVSIPRDPTTGIIIVPNNNLSPSAQSTPLGGRDWLKDGTNDEIADILSVRSMEDFVNLTLMNMLYGQSPDSITGIKNMMEEGIIFNFFPETRGEPGFLIDFSPKGIDRTRQIINSALDASPEFAWIVRQFGSVPIVTIDPDAVDSALSREILDPITGSPVTKLVSDYSRSKSIGGWSIGMFGIVLNTSSKYGRRRLPVGQRSRTTYYDANSQSVNEEYLGNVDLSMEGTLYHEWFHSFYGRIIGWHQNLRTTPGIPGQRQDRQDYLYPGVADAASITKLIKETFDSQRFIPYSTTVEGLARPILEKAARDIARTGDTLEDFISIMGNHETALGPNGALWTPEISRNTLDAIRARYPYLVADLAPLINVKYGTATRQEQFAETGTLFVTPDRRQRSNYLSPELEALYAYILGLKPDTSPGDYNRPWEQRSGLASRSTKNQHAISSLNERVHTGRELFVQAGEAHRRPDVVGSSAGMTDISINGYKFSIMGELPEWQEAYDAWNDWQENWRMRYISSEIMGLGALSSQADTRRWQSTANNHLKNGTINEAPSDIKEEIQRSAMMSLSIMKEIADSPYATDSPLYRSVNNVRDTDAIAGLNVGQTLSMPLTSFSPDYASVLGFSNSDDQTSIADAMIDRSNVIIKLREGTSVIYSPVSKPTPDTDGREVNMPIEAITAGEFVVKSRTTVNGVDVIEIEQSRVIDPLRGSRATDGRKKVEINKRRIKLNQDMTKSLQKIREKIQDRENANTNDEINNIDDDIAFEGKRYGTITRALRTRNDDFDKLDTPRTVGGLASTSSLENRAKRHGVSLEAFNDEGYDADDIEWSTNDWSLGKTNQVRAGDVVVVRTRSDGKKEILTIERKSGPFRGALSLPGGLQDEGEDLYDTAEREMLEEVNVSPTDAMDRRILGQVDVKDWDPRFVEGGRIAGIRFDLSEEQSSVVKAGDDAGKFSWVDVEEMSTGKYPIAFGHASWLAEAFADDEVLGPRFAVLAEASRVRNQRLIKKIDEKRREKGVKEFGEMPDPSIPYATTTEGIRTGLASARSGIKDINTSREIVGNATRLMRDNANLFDKDPIYDGYYGRTIDGAWVRDLVDGLKSNQKISHEDAVGMYLVLSAISDSKIYYTPETFSESFSIRMTLNNIRFKLSGNEEHTITLDNVGTERVWLAHRGSDYLGDYDTEEEALKAIQDSIADRTMIGPTKPAGLASTSSNNFSDTKSRYTESLDRNIADASDYLSRLEDALDEWNETGVWKGEDYGVVITPGRPPRNMTREEMLEVNYNPDNFSGAVQNRIDELGLELSDMEASRSRLDKQGVNTTPIEAILDDPETLARIEKRAEEVSSMSRAGRSELFRDGEYEYVVHWGADVLEGGVLDPARSRGDETSASTVGNTRRINKVTAMQLVANRDDQKQKLADLTKIQQEFEDTGMVNLSSAENPFGIERLIGSLISRGKDRNPSVNGDRAYRPFPDADDLNEMGIDELTPEMRENIATTIERSRNSSEQTLARLDKVADKLIEDDYQYSSTYPAEKLRTANGYGGRYSEEGDSWKNAPQATRTGIHVFRVRIGEDATRDTGGPDEVHIIGQHAPIASLSIETHRNAGNQPTSAQNTWQGWLAEVVEADKASRSGLASVSRFTPEQRDVYTSIQRQVSGLASRGTPINPAGKSVEEVAKEIELTPREVEILQEVLPDISSLQKMEVNPSIKDKKEELVNSVRVAVVDGIPFVYAAPNPMLSSEIPDERDWSAVIRPKAETAEKVKSLVEEMVKTTLGGKTAEEMYDLLYSGQDSPERKKLAKRTQDARLLRFAFADWSNSLMKDIASRNPFDSESNNYITDMGSGYGEPIFLQMWAQGLQDLRAPELSIFSPENETDGMHDMWGHVGIGRGFDRHGEWANMLAMFSLMDRWARENNISKDDLTLTKASWFHWLEYRKISGEFTPARIEINQRNNPQAQDIAYFNAIFGATNNQLEQLLTLIDDGNTHDTGRSKGLASASQSDKAEIAKKDIVRQSLKRNQTRSNGLASTSERNKNIVARLRESTKWFDSAKDTGSEKIVRDSAGRELSVLKEQISSMKDLDSDTRESLSDAVSKNGINSVRNNRPLISTLFGINPKDLKESDGTLFYTGSDWSAPIKIERELAIAAGDTEKVAKIDSYIDFVNNATPEEYAQAVIDASNNFGNSMDRRVKVMINNPLGLIENGRYLTQHDYDERMGVADAGGVARADVRQLRRNVEENLGIPNIQSGSPEDPYKDLRPASGLIQNESLGKQRESELQDIYGDDVEIIHPYTIGQPVDDSWTLDRENSYGRSSVILRAELAERSLFTNADSASGNPKAIVTSEMLGRDANGLSYGKGVGGMPQMLWNDIVDSGQSIMSPSRADGLFYNEALVAGSFTLDEVQAIVTNPNSFLPKDRQVGLVVRNDGSIIVGAYNGEPFDSDARALVEASKMRRKLKTENDVDLVVADLDSGSNFSVDKVEMFNPAMTETYITEVNPKAFPDVGPADLGAGATPMEALLMQRRIDVQNGKFQSSFSPELEKRLLEAKPEDVASLVEQAKQETLSIIDAEISELRKEATAITLSRNGRMPDMPARDVRGKSIAWVELSTKSFINDAPSFDIKSLNYTKPELRERIKKRIMASSKGGRPGQWSARKAQLLAMEYRKAGGGYRGGLRKTQRSLKKWTREKWTTSDGKPAIRKGGTRRYLPASAWSKLTPAQRAATNRKKISGSRAGNQFVANTRSAANASRRARN